MFREGAVPGAVPDRLHRLTFRELFRQESKLSLSSDLTIFLPRSSEACRDRLRNAATKKDGKLGDRFAVLTYRSSRFVARCIAQPERGFELASNEQRFSNAFCYGLRVQQLAK